MLSLTTLAQQWPVVNQEAKPGARWWWLGSAVDKENLEWNMRQYAEHGIGALEITPIYGVQGNQSNNIPYLTDKWMEMLRFTQQQGKEKGIEIDMATGTGWPFGGPWVPLEESACKAIFIQKEFTGRKVKKLEMQPEERDLKDSRLQIVMAYPEDMAGKKLAIDPVNVTSFMKNGRLTWKAPKIKDIQVKWKLTAVYIRYGIMKVKRAAPGGEGLVIDHFDKTAVKNYLDHIAAAFERTGTPYPHTFFNDSYEVADATWTPTLLDEFSRRRGYRLENHLNELINGDVKIVADYRETLADMLLENFTNQWTAWAHNHGAITRNQAHGSPANLIDCYAAVDIPEIEGFGLSELGIKGLRQDSGKTRKNDSDFSMLKYAPSAAHIMGKPYTSSETFTWLTEHFRTSLSQLKPDMDLMFCAGVNHMFFHGTCYSPKDDPWPGWKFYASIDMSPTNTIWRDAPYFMKYVERCQSFLQWGKPDNDFLVYLPVRDMWQKNPKKLLMQFSIHQMGKLAPEFIQSILAIDKAGFDCDYISEKILLSTVYRNGMLETAAGTRYKGLIIPGENIMTDELRNHINLLKSQGANIIYGTDAGQLSKAARPEPMKTQFGIKMIRRSNDTGYHYFIANLTPNDIDDAVTLGVDFESAMWFDPMNGNRYAAQTENGKLRFTLKSGESMILQTFNNADEDLTSQLSTLPVKAKNSTAKYSFNEEWKLSFTESTPEIKEYYSLTGLESWDKIDRRTRTLMGTGIYKGFIVLPNKGITPSCKWKLDLGDVRESARVYINDVFVGCAWAVPFELQFDGILQPGRNNIRIEVTNLPANRIAELDRQGVKWRKMEEINVVDINYKKTTYDNWNTVTSGLNSDVFLYRME